MFYLRAPIFTFFINLDKIGTDIHIMYRITLRFVKISGMEAALYLGV